MRYRLLFLSVASVFLLMACTRIWGFGGTKGSGNSKTEQRQIAEFTRLEAGGAYDIEVVCGKSPSLEITGDDNILPLITTEVRGTTLYIKNKESIRPELKLRVKVTTPNLEDAEASGACNLRISGVRNDRLRVETGGAGQVDVAAVTKTLRIETSGAGDVRASGSAESFAVETSGAGEVRARDLAAQSVKVQVSGAGDVEVTAKESLDVEVSGVGHVSYYGNPKSVSQRISGAGSIKRKE